MPRALFILKCECVDNCAGLRGAPPRARPRRPRVRRASRSPRWGLVPSMVMRRLLMLLAATVSPASTYSRTKGELAKASSSGGLPNVPTDFWREDLYDPNDRWAEKYPHPKKVRLPPGPLVRALPQFVASDTFRLNYFEKLTVLLESDEEQTPTSKPILSPEDTYSGGPYTFGPPNIDDPLYPKNVWFARGSFAALDATERPSVEGGEIRAALDRGETVFFNDISSWEPDVARAAYGMADALGLRTAVNAYMTPPGVSTSMATHNDIQCTFIIQTSGVKHWKVWLRSAVMAATDTKLTVGKQASSQVDVDRLGPPDIETDLKPGQVLYVPRGALHHTSTSLVETSDSALTSVPSLHLTLGVNVVRTDPKVDGSAYAAQLAKQFNHSVENTAARLILARSPVATSSLTSFYTEYYNLAQSMTLHDPRFRRSLMYGDIRRTKETIKDMISGIVDGLMESPDFLPAIAADVNNEHELWRAERRDQISKMLGEPFVPDELVREASGLQQDAAPAQRTCSASQLEAWRKLKLSKLVDVASEQGVSDDAIDAAMDSSDTPKTALLQLLQAAC